MGIALNKRDRKDLAPRKETGTVTKEIKTSKFLFKYTQQLFAEGEVIIGEYVFLHIEVNIRNNCPSLYTKVIFLREIICSPKV